jgi:hypothetical protein
MSDAACKSFDNGIWLCDICERKVDTDWRHYPKEKLQKWKREAEAYVAGLVTQDTRLRELRSMVIQLLSALRIFSALPGPGKKFDQTTRDAAGIDLTRLFIESEQVLFENGFEDEAAKVGSIGQELDQKVYPAIRANASMEHLDAVDWKNQSVRVLMIDVMHFKEASYQRYLRTEMNMVESARAKILRESRTIRKLT